MMTHVLTGTLYPATLSEPYAYLPFEVLEGTTRLELRFRHDKGNVIDLGVLDPHFDIDTYPQTEGFRGWSGGARDGFFLTRTDATPGYLAGELFPGVWQVMLGLYKVKPQGCAYRIEIGLESTPQPGKAPARALPKPERRAGWYRSDLHAHTYHSDAKGSLEDLLRAAEARGLEVLAVTDHNTVSHHRVLEAAETSLLLVPGQEVTTSRGHANVWGDVGWADFRLRDDEDVAQLSAQVAERGGLFSLNHPKNTGYNWEFALPERFDCLEVWQSAWAYRNWESLALADRLLAAGRHFTFVGGSDRHQPGWPDPPFLQVGTPTTWLYLREWSVPEVLAALREGRTCISESPMGPRLEFTVTGVPMGGVLTAKERTCLVQTQVIGATGETLRYLSDRGVVRTVAVAEDPFTDTWNWRPEGHFLRAEVLADKTTGAEKTRLELAAAGTKLSAIQIAKVCAITRLRALSNPVFVASGDS